MKSVEVLEQEIARLEKELRSAQRSERDLTHRFIRSGEQERRLAFQAMENKIIAEKLREYLVVSENNNPSPPPRRTAIARLLGVAEERLQAPTVPHPREGKGLGRLIAPDPRDRAYTLRFENLRQSYGETDRKIRYWWTGGWWGDQGWLPHCVAYAWAHLLEDGPVTQPPFTPGVGPIVDPFVLYKTAQQVDEWQGENYDGTSVRAGAKTLQSWGLLKNYYWIYDTPTLLYTLLEVGPVVAGTWWFEGMDEPDSEGIIRPYGRPRGGHAYKLDGVNLKTRLVRVKNSWGRGWGKRGFAYLHIDDLHQLFPGGEFCVPSEVNPR